MIEVFPIRQPTLICKSFTSLAASSVLARSITSSIKNRNDLSLESIIKLLEMTAHNLSFEKIYTEFYPKILRYIDQFVNNEAEDLTQEIFLKVNNGLPKFQANSKVSTGFIK